MKLALLFTLLFSQVSFAWTLEALDTMDKVVMSVPGKNKRALMIPFSGVECKATENKNQVELNCKDKSGTSNTSVDCNDKTHVMSFAISVIDPAKPEETRLMRINCK